MAEEAFATKRVKRRKSFGLLFGSAGLLSSDASSSAARPKSHGQLRSSPDTHLGRCNANPDDGEDIALGANITRRRRGSRPQSSGSLLAFMGIRNRSDSFGDSMRNSGINRMSSTPIIHSDHATIEVDRSLARATTSFPRGRSKSLQKSKRNSMFGSLRSFGAAADEAPSKESSGEDEDIATFLGLGRSSLGGRVIHHGEVQTSAPMWRKKSQFLVLTDTHLVRFKNRSKAAEAFPSIYNQTSRSTNANLTPNRLSVVSLASLQDSNPSPTFNDSGSGIALNRILAVHKLEDGKPFFSVEVCYTEERLSKTSSLQIQLTDPLDAELWRSGIRDAAAEARALDPIPFESDSVEYVSRVLDQERDYDPYTMSVHRAVHRVPIKPTARSAADDNVKLVSAPCYLVIGVHRIHIIPLSKLSSRTSLASLNELDTGQSYGILSLTALNMQRGDDTINLVFRLPFKPPTQIQLSSAFAAEIALHIRHRAEYLRPQWIQQPYTFNVPSWLEEHFHTLPSNLAEEDGFFDRTLTAYCAAYEVDASNIRYSIDYSCEDAPCFQLMPPEGSVDGKGYGVFELLAVMKSLRYNETFKTISFGGVNLDVIQNLYDPYGFDCDAMRTRSNVELEIPGQEQMSVLTQEIRALALKSKEVRRMNFSFCLTRIPTTGKGEVDPGCGIPEAIFPLCRRRLTKVDWVILNGIKLGDSDLDYLIDAASQNSSQLRALEISHCGISIHDLDLILSTLTAQEDTLEAINISGVQGRLSAELFQQQIGYFAHIRKINLSHISRNTGPEPLIAPETLLNWELEELSLSHTVMNEKTVDSIAAYLASNKSSKLRELRLDQCGLTGRDVATFLYFMVDEKGQPRNIHLHVSENRLYIDYSLLFESIRQNKTPTHLTMKMMDFQKEDHFKQLIEVMRKNKSLKYLDISKASLPYDAGPETCKALQLMFEENTTVEELDISGEYAHLDVARFGIGLNLALTGLKKNKTLKVLRIEHQKLGLQGANTLASVLEENTSLLEVHCDNNEINLQSFTVLVNGLQKNKTLLHLPCVGRDREQAMERVRREIDLVNREPKRRNSNASAGGSVRRTIRAAVGATGVSGVRLTKSNKSRQSNSSSLISSSASSTSPSPELSNPEVQAILRSLRERWDLEVERLHRYLYRNYNLAHGITHPVDEHGNEIGDWDSLSDGRPKTAASLATFLEQFSFETDQGSHSRLPELGSKFGRKPESNKQVNGKKELITEIGILELPLLPPQRPLSDILSIPSVESNLHETGSYQFPTSVPSNAETGTNPELALPTPIHPRPTALRTQTSGSVLSGISSDGSINTSNGSANGLRKPSSGGSKSTSTSSSLRSILNPRMQVDKMKAQTRREPRVSVTFTHAPKLELDLPSIELTKF